MPQFAHAVRALRTGRVHLDVMHGGPRRDSSRQYVQSSVSDEDANAFVDGYTEQQDEKDAVIISCDRPPGTPEGRGAGK